MNALNDVLSAHLRIRRHATPGLPGFVLALVLPATGSVPVPACTAKVCVTDVRNGAIMESNITQRLVSAVAEAGSQRPTILYRHTPAAPHRELLR